MPIYNICNAVFDVPSNRRNTGNFNIQRQIEYNLQFQSKTVSTISTKISAQWALDHDFSIFVSNLHNINSSAMRLCLRNIDLMPVWIQCKPFLWHLGPYLCHNWIDFKSSEETLIFNTSETFETYLDLELSRRSSLRTWSSILRDPWSIYEVRSFFCTLQCLGKSWSVLENSFM